MKNRRSTNIRLLTILIALVITSIILMNVGSKSDSGEYTFNFQIRDTSAVDFIRIIGPTQQVNMQRDNEKWIVNNSYNADPAMMKVLLSIMASVESGKEIRKSELRATLPGIDTLPETKVSFFSGNETLQSFTCLGRKDRRITYFYDNNSDSDNYYQVYLPGYESYIAGLFEVKNIDWKDRLLYLGSIETFGELNVSYPGLPGYGYTFRVNDNPLPELNGRMDYDTSKVTQYLDQFRFLLADKYVELGENEAYDSLLTTEAYCTISIGDFLGENPFSISFYPVLEGENHHLAITSEDELCLFDQNRIKNYFQIIDYFFNEN